MNSYHGFPEPMNIPKEYEEDNQGRKSIAMYYYTIPTGREKHRIIFPLDPGFHYESTTE